MIANYEYRKYELNSKAWAGMYKNLVNRPHWHSDYEIIHVNEGTAEVFVSKKTYQLKQGDTLFVHSKEIHYINSRDSLISMIIFEQRLGDDILAGYRLCDPLLKENPSFEDLFLKISQEKSTKQKYHHMMIEIYIKSFLINLIRNEKTEIDNSKENEKDKLYYELLKEIDDNFTTYTFPEAASFMAMSEPYFSKHFKEKTGVTFSYYLNTIRVEKAIRMLKDNPGLSITTVALSSGFDTIRNFNRVFKDIVGFTPKKLPKDYQFVLPQKAYAKKSVDPTSEESELLLSTLS